MNRYSLSNMMFACFFSSRLPLLLFSLFILELLLIEVSDLNPPLIVLLLPLIVGPVIMYFWAKYLFEQHQKDLNNKLILITKSLQRVDYWHYFAGSAIGVNVKSKKLHLIPANGTSRIVRFDQIIKLNSTVQNPDVQYTRSIKVSVSGTVTDSHHKSIADTMLNEQRRIDAMRNSGLLFSLDVLNSPVIFITMKNADMPYWSRLLQHLSEGRLTTQNEPQFFPN